MRKWLGSLENSLTLWGFSSVCCKRSISSPLNESEKAAEKAVSTDLQCSKSSLSNSRLWPPFLCQSHRCATIRRKARNLENPPAQRKEAKACFSDESPKTTAVSTSGKAALNPYRHRLSRVNLYRLHLPYPLLDFTGLKLKLTLSRLEGTNE